MFATKSGSHSFVAVVWVLTASLLFVSLFVFLPTDDRSAFLIDEIVLESDLEQCDTEFLECWQHCQLELHSPCPVHYEHWDDSPDISSQASMESHHQRGPPGIIHSTF